MIDEYNGLTPKQFGRSTSDIHNIQLKKKNKQASK